MLLTGSETKEAQTAFEESRNPPEKNTEIRDVTTLDAEQAAEQLPNYIFNEFGEEVTRKILRGTGDLELCVGDAFITIIPGTKTILLPINRAPLVEGWLRAPWRDAIRNFESSFITLKLKPTMSEKPKYGLGALDEEDIDSFSIDKIRKDPDEGHRFFDKKREGRVGVTLSGVRALEEGPKVNSISPEDEIVQSEENQGNLFTSEITISDRSLIADVMHETSSLAKEFIEPKVQLINSAVEAFNAWLGYKSYGLVNPKDVTMSLLYKTPEKGTVNYKEHPKPNLTPLVLSPSICIFRGYRGFHEDTLVVAQTKEGWRTKFVPGNNKEYLSETIDKWLEEES